MKLQPFQYSQIQKLEKSLGCEKSFMLGCTQQIHEHREENSPLFLNKVPAVFTPLWTSSRSVFHRTTPERMERLAVTNTTDFQR